MSSLDSIDNLNLICNGLIHLKFELLRDKPSYFKNASTFVNNDSRGIEKFE